MAFWACILQSYSDRSINQSINRSIDRLIDWWSSINQSINQSIDRSIDRSIGRSTNQPTNQLINQSINQSIGQIINQPKSRFLWRQSSQRRSLGVCTLKKPRLKASLKLYPTDITVFQFMWKIVPQRWRWGAETAWFISRRRCTRHCHVALVYRPRSQARASTDLMTTECRDQQLISRFRWFFVNFDAFICICGLCTHDV